MLKFTHYLQATEDEIRGYVNSRIEEDYKKIRGPILFRNDPIPKNHMGKMARKEMKEWATKMCPHPSVINV